MMIIINKKISFQKTLAGFRREKAVIKGEKKVFLKWMLKKKKIMAISRIDN